MAQGRVSAMVATTTLVVVVALVLFSQTELACAATYTVGGANGWTFKVVGWPKGKTFRAGDTLVFNYAPGAHNVVVNNKLGYQKCTTPRGAKVYTTGKDQIKLVKGPNFFICNYAGHCKSGMKIAITAN